MGRHGKDVLGHHGNEANLVLGHHGNKAKLVLGHFPVSNERSQASFRCMTWFSFCAGNCISIPQTLNRRKLVGNDNC